jgi:vacuolar-type H+-ATPase subunit H
LFFEILTALFSERKAERSQFNLIRSHKSKASSMKANDKRSRAVEFAIATLFEILGTERLVNNSL